MVAIVSIQFGATLAKTLFPALGAEGVTLLRLFYASVILFILFRPWRYSVTKAERRLIIRYGLALGIMNLVFYAAIERIPLGLAVAIEFSGPLAVAIGMAKRGIDWLWAAFAGAGIYLILPIGEVNHPLDPLGFFFALVAGIFWGLYILAGKSAGAKIRGSVTTSYGMLVATLVALPIGLYSAGERLLVPNIIPAALGVGIFSSAIPYTMEMIALKRLPHHTFGILMSLEPAAASLIAYWLLGEVLTFRQLFAIALIMTASAGVSAFRRNVFEKSQV